jgi:hypothetical protein
MLVLEFDKQDPVSELHDSIRLAETAAQGIEVLDPRVTSVLRDPSPQVLMARLLILDPL